MGEAQGWTEALARNLWPAALALALAAALVWLGRLLARRRPHGLKELERALRQLAQGKFDAAPEVTPEDPAAPAAVQLAELAQRLRERFGRAERRAALLAEGLDAQPRHGLVVLDRDFFVAAANEGAAQLFGGRVADLEGRPLQDLIAPESFRSLAAEAAELRRSGSGFAIELAPRRAEAAGGPLSAQAVWIGAPPERLALLVEGAGPVEAEPPRTALERVSAVLDGLADGVLLVSGGQVLNANPQAVKWLGAGAQGARLSALLAAEDLLLVLDRVARAERGDAVAPLTCRLLPVDAALPPRDVDLFAAPVRFGGRSAAALTLRDLDPERRAERRAREHEARLLAVLDAVGEGLLLLTPPLAPGAPWRVGLVNRRLLEVFGLEAADVLGAPEEEFRARAAHRFKQPGAFAALAAAAARESRATHEGSFDLSGAGAVELFAAPVTSEDGELIGRILVVRDVTHHRETQQQLAADAADLGRSREALQRACEQLTTVNRDLEQKTATLDGLNRELVELDRARAQLLGDVTHELQTPLVSIRGYTQMILEGRLGRINDEQRRGLEVALRNVDRMVGLINGLLALARSEGGAPLRPTAVDPGPLIAEVLERHQEDARRRGVRLDARLETPAVEVLAEREGLFLVLDNLVANGVKFNRPNGQVTITVSAGRAGVVTFEVADTGIGVPVEERERIFERFYRGRGAAGTSGAGIGLATVQNVVQRHGGRIEVDGAPGQGAVFRVHWPRATAGQTAPPAAAAAG